MKQQYRIRPKIDERSDISVKSLSNEGTTEPTSLLKIYKNTLEQHTQTYCFVNKLEIFESKPLVRF